MLLTVHLAPKTYWIRPDAGEAGGILNTATAGSVNACRSLEVLEDDLKDGLGVELIWSRRHKDRAEGTRWLAYLRKSHAEHVDWSRMK